MQFVKDMKKYSFLLAELVKKEVKLKYRSSYLGILWTLLEPLLTMIVLTLVFSGLLGRGTADFPVYILTGRLLFSFFSASTLAALRSVRKHAAMIKKVYVPKYMYPLSAVLSSYVTFLISLIVLFAVALARGVYPTFYIFQAIVPLFAILLISLGLGLLLSSIAVFFRDMEYLWGVVTMIIMYACAIFYKAESVISEKNKWIFNLNPVYACIENFRSAVFGEAMTPYYTFYSLGCGVLFMVVGSITFKKNQDKFILHL